MKKKILFVCMGNICRSPAAEEIFRQKVAAAGLGDRYEIDSAGTYSGHQGDLPDPRMRRAAERRGYMLTHRARPVMDEDFGRFDMLIVEFDLIVGREILNHPRILIVDQPTWGVDVGAAAVIRNALVKLRSEGAAIVVVSEEIDELYEICDRIAVMYRGYMSPAVPVQSLGMEELGRWMAGLWSGSPFKKKTREAN